MKKCCLSAVLLAMILSLFGCSSARFTVPTTYDSLNTTEKVTVTVKEGSISDTGLILLINNNTVNELSCDMVYAIEQQQNGQWYATKNDEQEFISLAMLLSPEQQHEFRVNWEQELSAGTYRVIKPVYIGAGIQYFSAEFEIE